MEIFKENFHQSFLIPQGVDVMKAILEFDLSVESERVKHEDALKGGVRKVYISMIRDEITKVIKEHQGTSEAKHLNALLGHMEVLAVDLDIGLYK